MGPLKEYPGGTLKNNIQFVGRANPEEEDCDAAQGEVKRTKKTPDKVENGKEVRAPSDDSEDAWKEARNPNNRRREESDEESEEAERAQKTDFPAEAESTKKDAVITSHVPGGTWLLQPDNPAKWLTRINPQISPD
ncbi:hypothetical protein NDU88_006620 [Pleurodeles waltl]|uniref:Uncharacterized protein n=1 Tax=Pleurodeles waltl TaxID=8319 RepID=A0AAV7VQ98_PLEWA|nr:hypothetical protein NDU88_006620 [Pleurodeles waltl]